jgi:hypothetical protein
MTFPAVHSIQALRVTHMDMPQGVFHGSLHRGDGHHVDVIGHEAIRQYLKPITPTVAVQQCQVSLAIRI